LIDFITHLRAAVALTLPLAAKLVVSPALALRRTGRLVV
jgi:hypothetical protein